MRNGATLKTVSGVPPPLGISGGSGRLLRHPVPRHQFVDTFLWPAIHEACQQVGKIDLRIDAIELAGLCRPPNYAERARFRQKLP